MFHVSQSERSFERVGGLTWDRPAVLKGHAVCTTEPFLQYIREESAGLFTGQGSKSTMCSDFIPDNDETAF